VLCGSCGRAVQPDARFCPDCGAAISRPSPATPPSDATHLADDGTRLAPPGAPAGSRPAPKAVGTGWLTSSGSIDHGRFDPGAMFDGRYRIVGLLGKGGMGAVYRADDLRLGQPVALKFLPADLTRDPARLAQFHNEVRTARQVSHANVCRVYDIGEADGHLYLSMEYVDGEDLASSIRRVGRFPEERALEIARQLCAGIAAAHERGIVHRDLKPANVMLDSQGRVRVMDFGLAAAGVVTDIRAGTPAYMAPEQLQGREVTTRSDIFALGLILYELFTGRRAFAASTLEDLLEQHESSDISSPTTLVRTLDPAIEAAILRCLDRDPARRPASALAVSAALPGGDPLAAALAAGETPSPELVAAAGGERAAISVGAGLACLAFVVTGLVFSMALADRYLDLNQTPLPLEPRVLEDRARTFEQSVGLGDRAVDRASGLFVNTDIESWIAAIPDAAAREAIRRSGWPSPLLFWYRSSPRMLVPGSALTPVPGRGDPPHLLTGMTVVGMTPSGRLIEFQSVPAQVESRAEPAKTPVDWAAFFRAAGLDQARFTTATPDWTPRVYADERHAWIGTADGVPGELRIEAASHRGVPVNFQIVGGWARPTRMQAQPSAGPTQIVGTIASVVIVPGCLVAAAWLARRNLRLDRADRRGAARGAPRVVINQMLRWLIGAAHFPDADIEQNRFFSALAAALLSAGIAVVLYLAMEPQVRRAWPQMLITWSRLLGGRVRDPLVGRDLLIGAAAGVLLTVITYAHYLLAGLLGVAEFPPANADLDMLLGLRPQVAAMLGPVQFGLENAFLGALGLVLVRMWVKRPWLTYAIPTFVFAFLAARNQFETGSVVLNLALGALLCGVLLAVVMRFGLVAGAATFLTHFLTSGTPMTLDTHRFYFGHGAFTAGVVIAMAVAGYALAGRSGRSSDRPARTPLSRSA
jgi:serine/threonine-protein kinase